MDIYKSNVKQAFNDDCKVVDLRKEYDDPIGEVKFAIVTDLSEEELCSLYEEFIKELRPFVILSTELGEAIGWYWRNEKKYEARHRRSEIEFSPAETGTEVKYGLFVPDAQVLDERREMYEKQMERIRSAFKTLTHVQRRRLVDYHLLEKTLEEIADEEGISATGIYKSIKRAERSFIAAYERLEVAS